MFQDTIMDRALKTAADKLESQFQARIDEKLAQQHVRFQEQLNVERAYAEVGRAVMNELRKRDGSIPYVPTAGSGIEKLVAKYVVMGKDFDTLMTAIKADVMLTSEWDRFMMMLRMAQED
jgi:hypothetical protein